MRARIERLNELGFDVGEVELMTSDQGVRLRVETRVAEPGHNRRELFRLTGLEAQERQAQRLVNDTYPTFVRNRLPQHPQADVDRLDGLMFTTVHP